MPPNFLLPESIVKGDGVGPKIDIGQTRGKLLVLTLGITSIVEQESLEVSTWGSEDGDAWGTRPLATFPLKFYCGLYSILLNLAVHTEIIFVRGQWKMSRWSKGGARPEFGFYLYAEQSGSRSLPSQRNSHQAEASRPSIAISFPPLLVRHSPRWSAPPFDTSHGEAFQNDDGFGDMVPSGSSGNTVLRATTKSLVLSHESSRNG
jgi:hypothetical protein